MAKRSDDIFKFLEAANRGDLSYVDRMLDDEVKSLSPFVLLMWANGAKTNNYIHVLMTNLYMNEVTFGLAKHPRLLLKLFISANSDIGNTRYGFKKYGATKETIKVQALADYYQCGTAAAKQYAMILSDEDVADIVERQTGEATKK